MKIKNYIFGGMACVMFGLSGIVSAHAETLTSKEYVDAIATATTTAVTNLNTKVDTAEQSLGNRITELESTVGGEGSGLAQDFSDLKDTVLGSDGDGGLKKDLEDLQGTVAGNKTDIENQLSQQNTTLQANIDAKLDKNQGAERANKVATTNASGEVTFVDSISQSAVSGLSTDLALKADQEDLDELATLVGSEEELDSGITADTVIGAINELRVAMADLADDDTVTSLSQELNELQAKVGNDDLSADSYGDVITALNHVYEDLQALLGNRQNNSVVIIDDSGQITSTVGSCNGSDLCVLSWNGTAFEWTNVTLAAN